MNKLQTELNERIISVVLDIISRDTGKDVGDFGGAHGLSEWLKVNGFNDHAALLVNNVIGE